MCNRKRDQGENKVASCPDTSSILRAGRLTAQWNNGRLLNVSADQEVLVSEIYFALRDENWGTIPYQIENETLVCKKDSFLLTFQATHKQGEIEFSWQGTVSGSSDSKISYEFHGTCGTSFRRNRIGFCVLHPARCGGQPCVVQHSDGREEQGQFPVYIAPHQPFLDMAALTYGVGQGAAVQVDFWGDVFEMEDQRNWTDASFKTYCTPLERPFPVSVQRGDGIAQRICVTLCQEDGENGRTPAGEKPSVPVESEGIALGCEWMSPLSRVQQEWVSALELDYFRYDWHAEEYQASFPKVAEQVCAMKQRLCMAVFLSSEYETELVQVKKCLQQVSGQLRSILVYGEATNVPSREILARAKEECSSFGVPVGSGTDAYFTQINREPIDGDGVDFITYSNNPQVHAFDEASILSTTQGQIANVKSCQHLYPGKPIAVGPVTMKIRWNPDATTQIKDLRQMRPADPRQSSNFAACWFLKSVASLCLAGGVRSGTYFELSGPRGLMSEEKEGGEAPRRYPLYYAVWALRGLSTARVKIDQNETRLAMRLTWPNRSRSIVCNLTPGEVVVDHPFGSNHKAGWVIQGEGGAGWLSEQAVDPSKDIVLQGYEIFVAE